MARFNGGWVKLYRSVMEGDIKDNPLLLALWSWLLAAATWKESKILEDGKQRVLPPGTVVFGMSELADSWKCSKATISKWAHYLHDTQRISLETRTRGSIATILNWDVYQGEEADERTPSEHQVNAERTPSEHQVNGSEEEKKRRKKKEENTPSSPEIKTAVEEWRKTLKARGIEKNPYSDQAAIEAILKAKGLEATLDAIRGLRFETGDKSYDPSKFCYLSRLTKNRFEKFGYLESIGARHRDADRKAEFYDPPQGELLNGDKGAHA